MTLYFRDEQSGMWIPMFDGKVFSLWAIDLNELTSWHRNMRRIQGRTPMLVMRYW